MTQNIYDDQNFFAGYSALPRSVDGLAAAAEWPAMRALLPDMIGVRALDLGCGFGWFCRYAREHGAARVLGVDVSEKMLARARADTRDAAIIYERADLETFAPARGAFDLVYSSLAFHYVVALDKLIQRIHDALAPRGALVFSAEHPVYTAPSRPGWSMDESGRRIWPVDQYCIEGPRATDWLAEGVIKQHRTIGTYATLLLGSGLTLTHIEEWRPTHAQIATRPELADELHRPMFLLMAARR